MGHNNLTINNQAPTINSKIDFTNAYPSILIGRNHSQAYSSNPSSPSLSAGSALYVYDTAPINTITGATITSNSGWISGVTLPSGTYVMTPEEASEAVKILNPKIAVPMHYGVICGTDADAVKFKELASCNVEILDSISKAE